MANKPPRGRIGRVAPSKSVPTAKPAARIGRPAVYEDEKARKKANNDRAAERRAQENAAISDQNIAATGDEVARIAQENASKQPAPLPIEEVEPHPRDLMRQDTEGLLDSEDYDLARITERRRRFYSPLNKDNFPKLLDTNLGHVWKLQGYIDEMQSRLHAYKSGFRADEMRDENGAWGDSYIDTGEDTRILSHKRKYEYGENGPNRRIRNQFGGDARLEAAVRVPNEHLRLAQSALDKHIFAHQDGNGGTARLYLQEAADHLMQAYNHVAKKGRGGGNTSETAFSAILGDGEKNEYKDQIKLGPMSAVISGAVNEYSKRIASYYNEQEPELRSYSRGVDTAAVDSNNEKLRDAYFAEGKTEGSNAILDEVKPPLSEEEQQKHAEKFAEKPSEDDFKDLEDADLDEKDEGRTDRYYGYNSAVTSSTLQTNAILRAKGTMRSRPKKPKTVYIPTEADKAAKAASLKVRQDQADAKEHWLNQPGNTALSYINSEAMRDPSGYMEKVRTATPSAAAPKLSAEEYQGHVDNIVKHLRTGRDVPEESARAIGPEGVAWARREFATKTRIITPIELSDPMGEKMRVDKPEGDSGNPEFENMSGEDFEGTQGPAEKPQTASFKKRRSEFYGQVPADQNHEGGE